MAKRPLSRKSQRIALLAGGAVAMLVVSVSVGFLYRDAFAFFMSPSDIAAAPPSPDQLLRIGGLVETGSLERGAGEEVRFAVSDGGASVTVAYVGILPDLFREGQGIVAEGYFRDGRFEAREVLAKHDENYVPKEVADALKKQGVWKGDGPPPADGGAGSGS
ncbi:MAG: cytochrome c maturation protein CcmE [Pseudomonadota bacterium]